jgi:prevent-host-death family protein
MKTIQVGAFDAKTHLSRLLDEVESGAVVRISRRGKPVAVLMQDEQVSVKRSLEALSTLRGLCRKSSGAKEIIALRDEGRSR